MLKPLVGQGGSGGELASVPCRNDDRSVIANGAKKNSTTMTPMP
jgi:hypothetical protein